MLILYVYGEVLEQKGFGRQHHRVKTSLVVCKGWATGEPQFKLTPEALVKLQSTLECIKDYYSQKQGGPIPWKDAIQRMFEKVDDKAFMDNLNFLTKNQIDSLKALIRSRWRYCRIAPI